MMCVECGDEVVALEDGACRTCFQARNTLLVLPLVLDLEVCAHCGARRQGAHWIDPPEGEPERFARETLVRQELRAHPAVTVDAVDIEETAEDEKNHRFRLHARGRLAMEEVVADAETLVRTRKGVCDRCSRLKGGFYAAVIQLRATDRDVTEFELRRAHKVVQEELDRQQRAGNRDAFLAKSGPEHGGHDYFIGDIDAGRAVSRILQERLGAQTTESAKLVGRREGDDVYRVTFLVRIRLFAAGDFAQHGERVVQVHSIERGRAHCTDLVTFQRTKLPEDGLRRLGGQELVEEAVFVVEGPEGLQILDPRSQRTVTVLAPPGPRGDTVPVVRHEERLYVVAVSW